MKRKALRSWDVVIVGAGPAGLSAALVLGRCTRRVLVCDRDTPRSWASKAMYGFVSRDGIPPRQFRRRAVDELKRYKTVHFWRGEIADAGFHNRGGFNVRIGNDTVQCRKLLLATGVMDQLPNIQGFVELFGKNVFQCPYCDGWQFRDKPLAAYGKKLRGMEIARALTAWSSDILLCTDGVARFSATHRRHLERNGIKICDTKIDRLESSRSEVIVVFRDGESVSRSALFFDTPVRSQSSLAAKLGCTFNRHGGVVCGKYEATAVPGVYVAGNIIKDVQMSIVAAAEGARAAFGINRALTREDFERRATGSRRVEHPVR
jgi:thioredoxin reductase